MAVPPVPVTVAVAATRDVPLQVQAIGTVEAYTTVMVKAQVSAELDQVHFKEGQEVKRGETLFTLDSRSFEADLSRAEANLARDTAQKKQAEANLARDVAQAQNASVQNERYLQLFKKGVASKEEYDQARTNLDALEAALNADKASIDNASQAIRADQAAIESARIQLGYCTIRSPIDGRTGSILVQQGNIVKANDSTPMVVIYQIQPIRVTFSIPEHYLSEVRRYISAGRVKVDANIPGQEDKPSEGLLTFVDNAVNAGTGTIMLKGTFTNADLQLWPGQFVNVSLMLSTIPKAVVVPTEAVQTGQQGTYVFIVKSDTVESRTVIPGRSLGGLTIIDKGIEPGETVVTDGQLRLVSGAKVQIRPGVLGTQERSS